MADVNVLKARQTSLQKKADLMLLAAERRDAPGLSDEEKKELKALEQEMDALTARIERVESDAELVAQVNDLTGGAGTRRATAAESWGKAFTSDPAIAAFLKAGISSGRFSSPLVDLNAATLLESTSPIVEPQYVPGIVPGAQPPVVMSQLFAPGSTSKGLIKYQKETLATNAAKPVAEGAAKPESTLGFAEVTEPLHKIATWLPASKETLEDVPQMVSGIDQRLRLFVLLELDNQLLNGSGVDPDMKGMLTRTDLTAAMPVGAGSVIDAIAKQIGAVEAASRVPVDGIVMNGTDWLSIALVKTSTGEYIAGSPFLQAGPKTLFGRRLALTPGMPQGSALVGSFRGGGGQLFLGPNMPTQFSDSHQDYFTKNLVAILSELRAALALYRPHAFGLVTGIPAPV